MTGPSGGVGGLPPAAPGQCDPCVQCGVDTPFVGWCLESTGEPVVIITRWSCDPEAVPSIVLLNPSTGAVIPNEPVVKCDMRDWEVNQLCDVGPDGEVYATVTQIFTFDQETGILSVSLVRADDPNTPYVPQGQLQTCSPGQLEVEAIQVCGNTAGTFRQLTEMALIDTRDGVIVSTFYIDATGATVALNPGEVLTVGDCYTPSLLGILDELEEVNQSLTDIQTQIATQINLLTDIESNTDGLEALITTTNTTLTTIDGHVDEIEPKLDTINQTLLDVIDAINNLAIEACCPETNNWLSQIAGYTDGIEGLITAGNATLTSIAGNTDGIETLITSTNTLLTSIVGFVDGIEGLIGTSNTLLTTISGATHLEDSAHVSGHRGAFVLGVRNDTDAIMTSADGDYSPIATDSSGRVKTTSVAISTPVTSGGLSIYRNLDVNATGQVIKGSQGQVYVIHAMNRSNKEAFLKLYNKATAPTNADIPVMTIPLGPNTGNQQNAVELEIDSGLAFSLGIGIRGTDLLTDADNTNPTSANAIVCNIGFK